MNEAQKKEMLRWQQIDSLLDSYNSGLLPLETMKTRILAIQAEAQAVEKDKKPVEAGKA